MKGVKIMALNKDQLQRFKKTQALAKDYCERVGGKLAHPINFDLLEIHQEKQQKVELDQQTKKDIQKQVQQAIKNGLKDVFK